MKGRRNSKNDVVWAESIKDAGELLDFACEKFDQNVMLWGGLTWKGLIPRDGPIFVHELKERLRKAGVELGPKGGINAAAYAWMITNEVLPEVRRLYPGGREVWQEERVKQRCPEDAEDRNTIIVEEWNRIDMDKELCRRLMRSIPKRLDAVVKSGGRQIRRKDYNSNDNNINPVPAPAPAL